MPDLQVPSYQAVTPQAMLFDDLDLQRDPVLGVLVELRLTLRHRFQQCHRLLLRQRIEFSVALRRHHDDGHTAFLRRVHRFALGLGQVVTEAVFGLGLIDSRDRCTPE